MPKLKKSQLLLMLVRLAIVAMAYQHILTPKSGLLPANAGRNLFTALKNAFKMGRLWFKTRRQAARYRKAAGAHSHPA